MKSINKKADIWKHNASQHEVLSGFFHAFNPIPNKAERLMMPKSNQVFVFVNDLKENRLYYELQI